MATKLQEVDGSVLWFCISVLFLFLYLFCPKVKLAFSSRYWIGAMKTEHTIFFLFKRLSYLIKWTLFQSSYGDFALLFPCLDHGIICSMSITCRQVQSFHFHVYVSKEKCPVHTVNDVNISFTLSNSIL